MNLNLHKVLLNAVLFIAPVLGFAQAPDMGTTVNFVLFSSDGAVSNTGISHLTGNVGTNNGSSTAFGNVNGVMHDGGAVSAQCSADLLSAYNELAGTTADFFPAPLLGNGQSLVAGVYSIGSAATLNLDLELDAEGDANAVFVIQIQGPLSTNAGSEIILANGALACNVFWQVEGLVSMATGTTMRGNIIANNSAIEMNTGCTLEGRALTTAGAITVDGVLGYTPIGCGSPVLTGPIAPDLGAAACFAIFSSDGAVSNSGISNITGDVGTNSGATSGFDSLTVIGEIHAIPDIATAQCAADLLVAYNYLNTLPYDIELLYPAQFGADLVLTPHTYLLSGAVTFTDTLYLNAEGNEDAVFVMQINGALSTSTYAKVILMNGAQEQNVYWKVEGAVDINNYSVFNGTIICNNGALSAVNTGVTLHGRALNTTGAITITASNVDIDATDCELVGVSTTDSPNEFASIYPNPCTESTVVQFNSAKSARGNTFSLYNGLGEIVMIKNINQSTTTIETSHLNQGVYFYTISGIGHDQSTGKLIIQK